MSRNTPKRSKAQSKKNKSAPDLSKQQRKDLAKLRSFGLLEPTGKEKASTLKRKISQAKNKYAAEINPDKSFFFKAPKGKAGKAILERADKIGLVTTDKGFFYERGFRQGSSGELKVTKTGKATLIISEPKTEKSRARKIAIPIETIDALESKQERLREEAEKLGPLKRGEHLTFRVTEKNREGLSKQHFRTAEQIFNWIGHYEKQRSRNLNTPAKQQLWRNYFYRHVEIVKFDNAEHREELAQIRADREKRREKYREAKAKKRKR